MNNEEAKRLVSEADDFSVDSMDEMIILVIFLCQGGTAKIPASRLRAVEHALITFTESKAMTRIQLGEFVVISTGKCEARELLKDMVRIGYSIETAG